MSTREFEPTEPTINKVDPQYLALLSDILENGAESTDRTGTGTKKVFGRMLKFDLNNGFPLLTTKRVWFTGVKEELLWFISGGRNIRPLVSRGVNIWNEWPFQNYLRKNNLEQQFLKYTPEWEEEMEKFVLRVKKNKKFAAKWGDLGPVYGYQWRHWKGPGRVEIDQLANTIDTIKKNPDNRRIIVSAWNPSVIDKMALPPCHMAYQFQVEGDKLNCAMLQRSVDSFLGLPFNIASYALLTHLVAKVTDKRPGELTLFLADTHIYLNHLEQVKLQLTREPRALPELSLNPNITNIDNISPDDIAVVGYNPHPNIPAPISV